MQETKAKHHKIILCNKWYDQISNINTTNSNKRQQNTKRFINTNKIGNTTAKIKKILQKEEVHLIRVQKKYQVFSSMLLSHFPYFLPNLHIINYQHQGRRMIEIFNRIAALAHLPEYKDSTAVMLLLRVVMINIEANDK